MLRLAPRNGTIGWVTAWAAAYALVFQLVLATALVAAMPRDASGAPICAAAASVSRDADQSGKGERADVHCAFCLARVDIADVPPPLPVPAAKRAVVAVAYAPSVPVVASRAPVRLSSQPRAPPFLG